MIVDIDTRINNENIKEGYSAKCKIITSQDDNVLVIPYESVLADDNGDEYVYKVIDSRAVKTYIQTSRELENGFEVLSGLNTSDTIIKYASKVNENDKINPKDMV